MNLEFESAPAAGQRRLVCEGIEWACLPLPFALDHVNCWLLGDRAHAVLIDTGVDNAATRKHWSTVYDNLKCWPARLLTTHYHPDHIGLAGWFTAQGCHDCLGSRHETELAAQLWALDDIDYAESMAHWYRTNGLPEDAVGTVQTSGNTYRNIVHAPPADQFWSFLQDGQALQLAGHAYTVMIGRGHAPDMIMLYRGADHVLIAADQVLPSISPNVSVMPRLRETNPLQRFLETLERLRALPDDTLVLPSHGLPFRGLHERLEALVQHHEMRLQQVLDACHEPRTAFELFGVLFRRRLDAQQMSFALGESLAHLHCLEQQGRLQRISDANRVRFMAN